MAPGRRERKKRATRDALGLAALELSLEHGIDSITIEQIAAAADVTARTFFNHFGSKEDAVVCAVQDELHLEESVRRPNRWAEHLRERPPEEPIMTAVRAAYKEAARDLGPSFERTARVWRMVFAAPSLVTRQINILGERNERGLAEVIAERLSARPERGIDADLLAACAFAGMRLAVLRFYRDPAASDGRRFYAMSDALFVQLGNGYGQARSAG